MLSDKDEGEAGLNRLMQCSSSKEVLTVLVEAPALRQRACVNELRERANAIAKTNEPLAEQIELVAFDLEALFACIDAAPGDGTIAGLNSWLAEHPHAWAGETKRLMLEECRGLRSRGDQANRRRILRALLTFRKLNQFHAFVWSKVKNGDDDLIEAL